MNKQQLKSKAFWIQGEKPTQYAAFLAYARVGTIRRTFESWEDVKEPLKAVGSFRFLFEGKPSRRTLEHWSTKYHWVERRALWNKEVDKSLSPKTKQMIQENKQKLSMVLRVSSKKLLNKRASAIFEKHLDQFEDLSLPLEERKKAARKIDRMINRRLKKHGANK